MARVKIALPEQFNFQTIIPIRITDLNYGNHVGNDAVLSLLHEARMQFLARHGYSEMSLQGTSLIMSDVSIIFKNEIFYGDEVKASVAAGNFGTVSFDLFYKLEKTESTNTILLATAKSGMVCFDYTKKKITTLPDEVKLKFVSRNN